jgi:hypothetical protein
MKSGRVFWGAFFILLGLLLLAARVGLFTICWSDLWRFWPLVLVLIGGALLLRGSKYSKLMLGLGGALCALLVVSLLTFTWIDGEWESSRESREQTFTVPYEAATQRASFVYDGGAGTLEIRDGVQGLFDAASRASFGEYSFFVDSVDGGKEIRMTFNGAGHRWRIGRFDHKATVALHPGPVWDLDMSLGASKVVLDLSALNVKSLRLENGATTARIKLGSLGEETSLHIDAGASSIRIEVPESAGCQVHVEAPISSKRLPGFVKMGDGEYRTENFSSAARKITIDIQAGASSIRVTRY